MPLTDRAYFNGEDHPRCTATPTADDVAADRALRRGAWECALPEGHERFANPRTRPHSWVMTGEDD